MNPSPLTGLKVIELASVLAGPSVGQFLAEAGAKVIKVEGPDGDVTRSWKSAGEGADSRSAYFSTVNWGKSSQIFDLKSREGQQALHSLVGSADVVITSFKPGDAERLQATYEIFQALNPKLIYGEITGYGSEPRVGYDAVLQAETGWLAMNGTPDGLPVKMPVALIDILAAHQLKEGILLALLHRAQYGTGMKISVSLYDTAVVSLANQANNWLMNGVAPGRLGSLHPNIAPYGEMFQTRDGQLMLLAVGSDRQFRDLCRILALEEVGTDPRFATNQQRVIHREALASLLHPAFGLRDSQDLHQRFLEASVPAGIVHPVDHVLQQANSQPLILRKGKITGLRQFVGSGFPQMELTPPPALDSDYFPEA